MNTPEPNIRVNVDVTNPGQFFACCGLLELADRLWNGAEGWFDESATLFQTAALIPTDDRDSESLFAALKKCKLSNIMTISQLNRLDELKAKRVKNLSTEEKAEKKSLEGMWREKPLELREPFPLRLDWFLDKHSDGSRFKTWAGRQSVIDIAQNMKQPLEAGDYSDVPVMDWFAHTSGHEVTFKFDADEGAHSSPLDVGFVLDPLGMSSSNRPLLELLAFVGLERFRPLPLSESKSYLYSTWTVPLLPAAASTAASGYTKTPGSRLYEFELLYRTKYLKSFLPAQPITR